MAYINSIVINKNIFKRQERKMAICTEDILWYGMGHYIYTKQRRPYKKNTTPVIDKLRKEGRFKEADERYELGAAIPNVWEFGIPPYKFPYPTQKPYKLLERIICLSTV